MAEALAHTGRSRNLAAGLALLVVLLVAMSLLSLAVGARAIPLGAPIFLTTTMPLSNTPLERLTMAQDTGGAIRGAVRADFFWGFGPDAGREAGRMRQQGRMWLLWPKGAPLPGS